MNAVMTPELAALTFLSPPRPVEHLLSEFMPRASRLYFQGPMGRVAVSRAGSGPKILLVHGWGGHSSDLASFAVPLVDAGYEVIAVDLPGHGESEGKMVSVPSAAEALIEVQKHTGDFHALIGHSVGSAVAVHAMGRGLSVNRAVLIAHAARYLDYAAQFGAKVGLNAQHIQEMRETLLKLGHDIASVDTSACAEALSQAALLLHSNDDRVVPVSDCREIAAVWPGSRLVVLDGLSHRRILQAPEVLAQVLSFIADYGGLVVA